MGRIKQGIYQGFSIHEIRSIIKMLKEEIIILEAPLNPSILDSLWRKTLAFHSGERLNYKLIIMKDLIFLVNCGDKDTFFASGLSKWINPVPKLSYPPPIHCILMNSNIRTEKCKVILTWAMIPSRSMPTMLWSKSFWRSRKVVSLGTCNTRGAPNLERQNFIIITR